MGIDNTSDTEQLVNLVVLVQQVLQPCREQFGSISINSGLRVLELNQAIGSSDKSQHINGEAADFEAYLISNRRLAEWIKEKLDFDQLILEYPGPDPRDGWVHCSYKRDGGNRKQVLTAVKEGSKTVYKKGLQE
jgi:hypothetical protein